MLGVISVVNKLLCLILLVGLILRTVAEASVAKMHRTVSHPTVSIQEITAESRLPL